MQPLDIVVPLLQAAAEAVPSGGVPSWVVWLLAGGYPPLFGFAYWQSRVIENELRQRNQMLLDELKATRSGKERAG